MQLKQYSEEHLRIDTMRWRLRCNREILSLEYLPRQAVIANRQFEVLLAIVAFGNVRHADDDWPVGWPFFASSRTPFLGLERTALCR